MDLFYGSYFKEKIKQKNQEAYKQLENNNKSKMTQQQKTIEI